MLLIVYNCGLVNITLSFFHESLITMHVERRPVLCMTFQGGLGNLLFQYAFLYASAKANNMTMFCKRKDINQLQALFHVPDCPRLYMGERICRKLPARTSQYDCGYDKNVTTFNKTDQLLKGYFQSWVYWKDEEPILREYFKIKQHIVNESDSILKRALKDLGYVRSNVTLVAMHIRRGDILTKKYLIKYGYNVPSAEYFKTAMEFIRSRVNGTIVYVVCSNDMTWTRKVIQDANVIFMEGGSREIDFAMMTSCDHLIMTVGSFGWWMGWMVKGIVIYYEKPFKTGTELGKKFTDDYRTTFYYPHWVGIS